LIPYTYRGEVRITLCVPAIAAGSLDNIRIAFNGRHVDYEIQGAKKGSHHLAFQTPLNDSDYSILVIHTPEMTSPKPGIGGEGLRSATSSSSPPTNQCGNRIHIERTFLALETEPANSILLVDAITDNRRPETDCTLSELNFLRQALLVS